MPDKWWTAFDDKELNALVDRALQSNFTLQTAWQRLREAQAVVDRESSALFPDLEAFAEVETGDTPSRDTESLQLGLTSSYEIDLWGRIRSAVEAERYRAQATLADYQTAALSISAEVVRTWYQLTAARNQLDILERQIESNGKILELIKNRFSNGQVRGADVLRQGQLLESTREQKLSVESRIQVLEHQLAVLLGQPPREEIPYARKSLPELPPFPVTGLPMELVQRRPDVLRAYNQLKAADRDVATAVSNRFPRLTLTASVSTSDEYADRLFEDWASSFAGSVAAPLFDAGRRKAEVDRTEARSKQRLYEYGQTILTAFREVEDALIREKKQEKQLLSLGEQARLASRTYEQLRTEYFNGASIYIDVLTALTDVQSLQRDVVSAELALLENRIALYRALAGGFEAGELNFLKEGREG